MLDTIKILVVEDDQDAFEGYSDSADDVSTEHDGITIELVNKTNTAEALESIKSDDFDGAIIDLNLDTTAPGVAEGNDVIESIYRKNRFPIKVISGNLNNLSDEIREKSSPFLCFHDRDVENDEVFGSFVSLYKTGITKILGRRGKLEEFLSEVFWNHLAHDMNDWSEDGCDEDTLLRYSLSHLNEYLDSSAYTYNGREFYIKPPIQEHISTGDIAEKAGQRYIVLSPACDVAPRGVVGGVPEINATKIILCPLLPLDRGTWIERGVIKAQDGKKSIKSALGKIVKNQEPKFHFMPEHGDLPATISDFQNIETCTINEYVDFNRLATVATPFMKDVQSRFSAYIGRQGQPDLDKSFLIDRHVEGLNPPPKS